MLTAGSALTAGAGFAAASIDSLVVVGVFLLVGGMAAASSNAASGRLVVGWFPPHQCWPVMGIRQTAVPLGVGLGGLVIPCLAASEGVSVALLFPAVICAASAVVCGLGVLDPPRPPRAEAPAGDLANPSYHGSATLTRIHALSVMLVVPQALVFTFTLVWFITDRSWSPESTGMLVALAQLWGSAGRVAVGFWS